MKVEAVLNKSEGVNTGELIINNLTLNRRMKID